MVIDCFIALNMTISPTLFTNRLNFVLSHTHGLS
jgi:hypothetical protein